MQRLATAAVHLRDPDLSPVQIAHAVEALVDAMASERRLVDELIAIMRRQREAVSRDDLQEVDDSVYAIQRVLFTLGEARKRRRALNQRIAHADDLSLRDLEVILGEAVTPPFADARAALQESARTLSNEVAVNRRLLREALAVGDDYVRALYGGAAAATRTPSYGQGAVPSVPGAGGFLVNRRA